MDNIERVKSRVVPVLKNGDVEFAGIFGSFARGEEKTDSDIDILVRFADQKSLLDLVHLENTLSDTLDRKVDVVTEGFISPYIKDYVLNDLRILYGERVK